MVVFHHGTTLKTSARDKPMVNSNTEEHGLPIEERIMLRVESHGKFRYRYPEDEGSQTSKFITDVFEFSTSVSPFEYIHDKATGVVRCISQLVSREQLELDIDGGHGKRHEPIPLQSPMGVWSITPAKNVDTSKVHKVEIVFDVSYRTN
ncbi:hypothetical protein BGZ49_007376 [Haplosporangium sp. Z 27]|nr:hypothetical protein BGZ49_007376 [Haplosporangium sp. Z 27]